MTQTKREKLIHAKLNNSSKKPKFDLFKKNVFTKNKWVKVDRYDSPVVAQEEANFIQGQKFIQSKDDFGGERPPIKTMTKIVRIE